MFPFPKERRKAFVFFCLGDGEIVQVREGRAVTWQKAGLELYTIWGFVFTAFRLLRQLSHQKEEKGKALPLVLGFGFQE